MVGRLRTSTDPLYFGNHMNLQTLIAFTAFVIASAAAYFSVTGIGKLFAGAAVAAMIMAAVLELGKLVSISFLYRYWKEVPKALKSYFLISSFVLMIITSLGIYGYLSSAYAKSSEEPLIINTQIAGLVAKDSSLAKTIQLKYNRIDQLTNVRQQQESRLDSTIAKTRTGNSVTVRNVQQAINENFQEVNRLQAEVDSLTTVKDSLNVQKLQLGVEVQTNSEIGTFMYVADLVGTDLDTVVKWFILIIVLVFDPLSICLVLAYNFLKVRETKPATPDKEYPVFQPSEDESTETESGQNGPESGPIAELPYFMQKDFDWSDTSRWENDPIAKNYKSITNQS